MPAFNPMPSALWSLDGWNTRVKKCCKDVPEIERISSEKYPLPAEQVRDLRGVQTVLGAVSRYDGRDPVLYAR